MDQKKEWDRGERKREGSEGCSSRIVRKDAKRRFYGGEETLIRGRRKTEANEGGGSRSVSDLSLTAGKAKVRDECLLVLGAERTEDREQALERAVLLSLSKVDNLGRDVS